MPPPKKPKSGPTSAAEFLSAEEIKEIEEHNAKLQHSPQGSTRSSRSSRDLSSPEPMETGNSHEHSTEDVSKKDHPGRESTSPLSSDSRGSNHVNTASDVPSQSGGAPASSNLSTEPPDNYLSDPQCSSSKGDGSSSLRQHLLPAPLSTASGQPHTASGPHQSLSRHPQSVSRHPQGSYLISHNLSPHQKESLEHSTQRTLDLTIPQSQVRDNVPQRRHLVQDDSSIPHSSQRLLQESESKDREISQRVQDDMALSSSSRARYELTHASSSTDIHSAYAERVRALTSTYHVPITRSSGQNRMSAFAPFGKSHLAQYPSSLGGLREHMLPPLIDIRAPLPPVTSPLKSPTTTSGQEQREQVARAAAAAYIEAHTGIRLAAVQHYVAAASSGDKVTKASRDEEGNTNQNQPLVKDTSPYVTPKTEPISEEPQMGRPPGPTMAPSHHMSNIPPHMQPHSQTMGSIGPQHSIPHHPPQPHHHQHQMPSQSMAMPSQSHMPQSPGAGHMEAQSSTGPSTSAVDLRKREEPTTGSGAVIRHCQVCNDTASGFHYGVWSCEGCKAFFKRSIQGPVDYMCPATNTCTIDKHRRKSCQACRLRRCFESGMSKGMITRRGRQSSAGKSGHSSEGKRKLMEADCGKTSTRKERRNSGQGRKRKDDKQDNPVHSSTGPHGPVKVKRESANSMHPIVEQLLAADPPILNSEHDHSIPDSETHLMTSLTKLADKELVYMINWAKHVPGYTDLTLNDQVHLLESSWFEVITLGIAQRSMPYRGEKLVFATDLIMCREKCLIARCAEVCELIMGVSRTLVELSVNKEEFVLMKAMCLINAEIKILDSRPRILQIQDMLVDALRDTTQRHYAGDVRRLSRLLLLMPHIRHASLRGVALLYSIKNESSIPICDLLREMLDAQSISQRNALRNPSQSLIPTHPGLAQPPSQPPPHPPHLP
ncbi:unnamed protein product [Owenia fusiformis]|uniref:Estrogen receptor n=1 Tax=Owenia fusiformis TaxID=6347 RepID=A0A8S4PEZ5_OWEFU|nr:unnamed protein product [Owenia fusiformis]